MNPCRRIEVDEAELARHAGEDLPAWAKEHVAACRSCRRRLEAARLADGLVRRLPEAALPPVGFADRVVAALPVAGATPSPTEESWRPAWGLIPTFAAAAVAAILLYQTSDVPGPVGFLTAEGLSTGEELVLGGALAPELDLILTAILEGGAK
jgi:hypothetical protein